MLYLKGVPVILIDTEDRLDEEWMKNIGINTEDENPYKNPNKLY